MSEPRMDHIMQVGLGFWASKTLLSAVEMELFTELAKHPETLPELSARLRLHPRSAHDFLDALVSLNFLERRDGTYYNTPSTDLFLDKRKPSYIAGIGFDLPEVAPIFEDYISDNGLSGRVCFHPGSFFDAPIPEADVVMMGHILHDWNLDDKKMLLRKAYEALPTGGTLIVYESIIDDDRSKNSFGLLMSLNMLIETPGGFDYTGADCMAWIKEAGFRNTRFEHLVGPDSMVVGIK